MLELDLLAISDRPEATVTHQFQPGKITVVLGRNGAGKSRLCRVIAGLDPLISGRIVINGKDNSEYQPGQRSVALVNQSFVNYPNLTVAQNIASPLHSQARRAQAKSGAAKLDKAARNDQVKDLARALQIEDLLQRKPADLSGGQQQRVAIARALAKQADVLLLDEPLVNLDYNLREDFEVELREILTTQGCVVIYTTSDPTDAFSLGDEVLLLHEHNLLQAGSAEFLYANPNSVVAADLFSDPGVNEFHRGTSRWVVRPEQLQLEPADAASESFNAVVEAIETNGSDTFLRCTVMDQQWIAKLAGLVELGIGDAVVLYVHPDDLMSFS